MKRQTTQTNTTLSIPHRLVGQPLRFLSSFMRIGGSTFDIRCQIVGVPLFHILRNYRLPFLSHTQHKQIHGISRLIYLFVHIVYTVFANIVLDTNHEE